jgi:hypothetical protein
MQLEIYRQILEKSSNVKFHNIRPVEAEMFYADRRTDKTKPIVALRNCESAYQNTQATIRGISLVFKDKD